MWGVWTFAILGFAAVMLLAVGLAVGAAPLLAILIFLLVTAVLGVGFVFSRGSEQVSGSAPPTAKDPSIPDPGRPSTPDGPKPSGRPVAGEGGTPAGSP
jgi:hypothetical protein